MSKKWRGPWIGKTLGAVELVLVGFDGVFWNSVDWGLTWAALGAPTDNAPSSSKKPDQDEKSLYSSFVSQKSMSVAGTLYYPVYTNLGTSTGVRTYKAGVSDFFAYPTLLDNSGNSIDPHTYPMLKGWATDASAYLYTLALYHDITVCLKIPVAAPATATEIGYTGTPGAGGRDYGGYIMRGLELWQGELWCAAYIEGGFGGLRHMTVTATAWTNESSGKSGNPRAKSVLGGDPAYLWVGMSSSSTDPWTNWLYTRSVAGVWALRSTITFNAATAVLKLVWAGADGKLLIWTSDTAPAGRRWKWTSDYGANWTEVGTAAATYTMGPVVVLTQQNGKVLISNVTFDGGTPHCHLLELDPALGTLTDITGTFHPAVDAANDPGVWFGVQ